MRGLGKLGILLMAALLAQACRPTGKEAGVDVGRFAGQGAGSAAGRGADSGQEVHLSHALGFTLRKNDSTMVVRVRKPWQGASVDFTYILKPSRSPSVAPSSSAAPLPSSAPAPKPVFHGRDTLVLRLPLRRMVTLTTTNLYHFEALGVLDSLVGLGGGRYVYNPAVRARMRAGKIREVGGDMQVDLEAVIGLKPDLVFTFVVGNSPDGSMAKLAETSVPTAVDGAYMEETPLGRAEWIKFTAAFFGKDRLADSLYAGVDSAYESLAALARKAKTRPTVFVNAPFGGVWWMPGGRSYVARFLADAGADYLWASDTTRGSLVLDLETVLAKAGGADFWLHPGDWHSLSEGRNLDPRHTFFKAFKEGKVFANDRIRGEQGGNDIFETGPARPDWVLADLISIFHPELLPGHSLRWYRKLGEKP